MNPEISTRQPCIFLLLSALLCCGVASAAPLVWAVDPLVKVFPDTVPANPPVAVQRFDAARGEHATFQVCVRAPLDLPAVSVSLQMKAKWFRPALAQCGFVGFVAVRRDAERPDPQSVGTVPGEFPDPIHDVAQWNIKAQRTQPVWATLRVPLDTPPGDYEGVISLRQTAPVGDWHHEVPVSLKVWPVQVKSTRLWLYQFLFLRSDLLKWHDPARPEADFKIGTPLFWQLMESHAQMLGDYRVNVSNLDVFDLVKIGFDAAGNPQTVDWANVDRYAAIFEKQGVFGRIIVSTFGDRFAEWKGPSGLYVLRAAKSGQESALLPPDDPQVRAFYAFFLPRLRAHFVKRGWWKKTWLRVVDENEAPQQASYEKSVALIKAFLPDAKIADTVLDASSAASIDLICPTLAAFYQEAEWQKYLELQRQGKEFWCYLCVHPHSLWANRFLRQQLVKSRYIYWLAARAGVTGVHHWGWNYYFGKESPWEVGHLGEGHADTPGDCWIAYPTKTGVARSIRLEAMRDGIVDYELIAMLRERNAARAKELTQKLVFGWWEYELDVAKFRAVRRQMLEELSRK